MKFTRSESRGSQAPGGRGPLGVRGRVLVAESSSGTRIGIRKVLLGAGFEVVECSAASDVVPLAKIHRPDVLILDAGIDRLDAAGCVQALEAFEGTRSVVVVLTCPRDMDAAQLARLEASGALLVLVKPLTREGLLQAFQQAFAEAGDLRKIEPSARRVA